MLLVLLALAAQVDAASPPADLADPPPAPSEAPAPAAPEALAEAPLAPAAPEQCTLAVLDLEVGDAMTAARARALSDIVTGEVAALSDCAALSRSDIRGILTLEAEKQLMGCASDSCMAELAGALGADLLVTGTISRIEGSMLLSLRLTDMKTLKVKRRATDSFAGDDAQAIAFVAWMARKVMTDDEKLIGPRPVAAPQVAAVAAAPATQSTVWRPLFWTSFVLTAVAGTVTAGAGAATLVMNDVIKDDFNAATQLEEVGPLTADVANGALYTTGGLALLTAVLFFFPAEEPVEPAAPTAPTPPVARAEVQQ